MPTIDQKCCAKVSYFSLCSSFFTIYCFEAIAILQNQALPSNLAEVRCLTTRLARSLFFS
ncbi:hypothetical protein [Nostoc commune]|uniref:hypothetical protein n=1 Tax=Nostoc commune TaxID=1178 RepID=UPI0018C4A7FD|nr:hypothetical protein [Nostoc commune]MBG1262504.1 hypothetical protein [Nostoc commune BAE]